MSKSDNVRPMPYDCEDELEKVTGGYMLNDEWIPNNYICCEYSGDPGPCGECKLFKTSDCIQGYRNPAAVR